MPFKKFVEIGRVAYAVGGKAKGKLIVIVDVIDYNRALIEGPCTGVCRQEYRFINLELTVHKIKIHHGQHTKFVRKAWIEAGIDEKWNGSRWAKAVQSKLIKASLNDFERFKVMHLKRKRNKLEKITRKDIIRTDKKKKVLKKLKRAKRERIPSKRKLKFQISSRFAALRRQKKLKPAAKTKPEGDKGEKKTTTPKKVVKVPIGFRNRRPRAGTRASSLKAAEEARKKAKLEKSGAKARGTKKSASKTKPAVKPAAKPAAPKAKKTAAAK